MITSDDMQKASRIPEVAEDQLDNAAFRWIREKIIEFDPYSPVELTEYNIQVYKYFFALGVKYGRCHEKKWWSNV